MRLTLLIRLIALLCLSGIASAHERWVKHELLDPNFDRSLFTSFTPLNTSLLLGLIGAVVLLRKLSANLEARRPASQSLPQSIRDGASLILGVTYGLGCILPSLSGEYLAPDLVATSSLGQALSLGNGVLGVMLLLGIFTRFASLATIAVFGFALVVRPFAPFDGEAVSFTAVLNYIDIVGIALFFLFAGRGRYSLDTIRQADKGHATQDTWTGTGLLRILTGFTLVVLGLQKFLLPELPMGVVQNYADVIFEPIHALTNCTPEQYVFGAAFVEFSVGALLVLGLFTRTLMVVLAILFTTTLFIFKGELVGHLPLFGIVIVLLIEGRGRYGTSPKARPFSKATPALLALAVCALPFFSSCSSQAQAAPESAYTESDGQVELPLLSDDGEVLFTLRFATPATSKLFAITTAVTDVATGMPVPGGTLSLNATMPEHGHGMQTEPQTHVVRDGDYNTAGMKFHMAGSWEFALKLANGGDSHFAHGRYIAGPSLAN